MLIFEQNTISQSKGLGGRKLGKEGEIADVLSQIPTFNVSNLKDKCKGINLDNIRGELTDIMQSIDEDLSIENFFIETPEDIKFIVGLGKNSERGPFDFKNKQELVDYLEERREYCSLPKELLKNTEKIPLKTFIKIYEEALEKTDEYYMIQDRF